MNCNRLFKSVILFFKSEILTMKTFTINLPDSVDEKDIMMQLAAQLFEKAILSSGQAAELAGISKRQFIETVGNYGITIFGESVEDLESVLNV